MEKLIKVSCFGHVVPSISFGWSPKLLCNLVSRWCEISVMRDGFSLEFQRVRISVAQEFLRAGLDGSRFVMIDKRQFGALYRSIFGMFSGGYLDNLTRCSAVAFLRSYRSIFVSLFPEQVSRYDYLHVKVCAPY